MKLVRSCNDRRVELPLCLIELPDMAPRPNSTRGLGVLFLHLPQGVLTFFLGPIERQQIITKPSVPE
jgi:hypothetical protein